MTNRASACHHGIAGGCWLCRKYQPEEWGAGATLALARDLGVKLEVDTDQNPLQILAKPKERITDELREALRDKANRDDLLRILLFRSVGEWIASLERPFEAPEDADEALNTAWHDADLEGFREALRAWVKAGLEAGKRKAAA